MELPEHEDGEVEAEVAIEPPEPAPPEDEPGGGEGEEKLGDEKPDDEDPDGEGLGLGFNRTKKKLTNAFNFCERAALTCNLPTRVSS